jgi:hypothetical protein
MVMVGRGIANAWLANKQIVQSNIRLTFLTLNSFFFQKRDATIA